MEVPRPQPIEQLTPSPSTRETSPSQLSGENLVDYWKLRALNAETRVRILETKCQSAVDIGRALVQSLGGQQAQVSE